jgi:hypothetical protein
MKELIILTPIEILGVIVMLFVSLILSLAIVHLTVGEPGTKGIKPDSFVSKKTGKKHTAIKQREEHIV